MEARGQEVGWAIQTACLSACLCLFSEQTWAPIITVYTPSPKGRGHTPNAGPPCPILRAPREGGDTPRAALPSWLALTYSGYLTHLPIPLGMPSPPVLSGGLFSYALWGFCFLFLKPLHYGKPTLLSKHHRSC